MMRAFAMLVLLCVTLAATTAVIPTVTAAVPAAATAAPSIPPRVLRDPFVRPAPPPLPAAAAAAAEPQVEVPPLRLRAVILNGTHSIANIDGDIVAAGGQARDYTVLRIDAQGVLVARAGKRQLLTIHQKDTQ